MKRFLVAPAWLTVLALAACSGETQLPDATGEGTVRAINAINTSPAISFLIEERVISTVDYKTGTGIATYDDLEYTFNFEAFLAGDTEVTRIGSQFLDVVRDTAYTFVIRGDLANPTISVWERPQPDFADGATTFEVQVGHLAESLADVDVYFADPATPPALGNAVGSLAGGEVLPISGFEAGDYVLTLTDAGDPAAVRFESETLTIDGGNAYLFTAFDSDQRDVAPIAMRRFDMAASASNRIPDANYPATFRFFHASADAGTVDIYVDDPLTVPVVAGHAFGDISGDIDMPSGTVPLTYTAAGNTGTILVDVDRTVVAGVRYFAYFVENAAGTLSEIEYAPDLRSVETLAKLSVIQTVPSEAGLDFYAIPTGDAIDDSLPFLNALQPGLLPVNLELRAAVLDIYITPFGEKTPLAGPIQVDLANGDIFQAVIYENVDPNVVDVVLVPLP